MARTDLDWSRYVQVEDNTVTIRSISVGLHSTWERQPAFSLAEAADLADYLNEVVKKAERENPEVVQLTRDLVDAELDSDPEDYLADYMADMALYLYRKGYRKQ